MNWNKTKKQSMGQTKDSKQYFKFLCFFSFETVK